MHGLRGEMRALVGLPEQTTLLRRLLVLGAVLLASGVASASPPLVVLDPGHGGSNLGTRSTDGAVFEKQVTLALARKVAARLEQAGVRVALTRAHDRYVSLRQRVDAANASGADVFVSLHTNACTAHRDRGFEIYLASPEAADVLARAAATGLPAAPAPPRDRGRDILSPDGLDALLADAERGAAQDQAAVVAHAIERRLSARTADAPELDRGIKQAAFDVLVGPRMPAVLVEAGFLDNPGDATELTSAAGQDSLADAIAAGIVDALGELADRPSGVVARADRRSVRRLRPRR